MMYSSLYKFILLASASTSLLPVAAAPSAGKVLPPPGSSSVDSCKVDFSKPNPNGNGGTWDSSDSLVSTGGKGCPAGSVSSVLAVDNSFVTVIFDNFQASIGPNITADNNRAFCRVNVVLNAPQGYFFDVNSTDYHAFVQLDKGVTGTLKSHYEFVGESGKGHTSRKITGPFDDDVVLQQTDLAKQVARTSCCRKNSTTFKLSLSASLTSTVKEGTGFIQADAADAAFKQVKQVVALKWKKC